MAFTIKDGRLREGTRTVDMVASQYTSGAFAKGEPKFLVIHFTYGGTGRSSAEWFRSPENPGSSAHLVIDRDGSIIQCVSLSTVAWHAGKSSWRGIDGLNRHSIGIELANWGYLKKSGNGWASYTGKAIADPFIAAHRNGNPSAYGKHEAIGWEPYPEAQWQACVAASRAILEAYPSIGEIIGHDDISIGRKWDPGPAFDMERFRAMVQGGRGENTGNLFAVAPGAGLNLRKGPGTAFDVISMLAAGTKLTPLETDGNWMMVSVLNDQGAPTSSGWVHRAYLIAL